MNTKVNKVFRIVDGREDFVFNIDGLGEFKGRQKDLIRELEVNKCKYLRSKLWVITGVYSVSRERIIGDTSLRKSLEKFRIV